MTEIKEKSSAQTIFNADSVLRRRWINIYVALPHRDRSADGGSAIGYCCRRGGGAFNHSLWHDDCYLTYAPNNFAPAASGVCH